MQEQARLKLNIPVCVCVCMRERASTRGLTDTQVEAVRRKKRRHRILGDTGQAQQKYIIMEFKFKESAIGTYIFVAINKWFR